MNETTVTVVGNAATEVKFRETSAGIPVASFRLASTARRWDREQGCWSDAHTSFYTVWAWRGLALNVAGSVGRGDPLVVTGRMRVQEWEKDGQRRTVAQIDAAALGHDMSRGTSAFRRVFRQARPDDAAGSAPNGAQAAGSDGVRAAGPDEAKAAPEEAAGPAEGATAAPAGREREPAATG